MSISTTLHILFRLPHRDKKLVGRAARAEGQNKSLRHALNRGDRGFTLMEVIVVVMLLSMLAAIAISRSNANEEAAIRVEIDTLKGHLRYAQYLAMNQATATATSPVQWGIQVTGSSYNLFKSGGTEDMLNLPGESSNTHNFKEGLSGSGNVLFNEWGSPGLSNFILTVGGESITITAETGFIP